MPPLRVLSGALQMPWVGRVHQAADSGTYRGGNAPRHTGARATPPSVGYGVPFHLMTPLGPLSFFAAMGPDVIGLSALCPGPNFSFSQEAFETSTARGALMMGAVDPGLLPEQRVDACYGVLWRVQALAWSRCRITTGWSSRARGGVHPHGPPWAGIPARRCRAVPGNSTS